MLGAIIGDIVGSRFEWNNIKTKEFDFLTVECKATDDSVMTLAIAKALMDCHGDYANLREKAVHCMQTIGNRYPYCDYGSMFRRWLASENPQPYGSYGNGSAMRVSACAHAAKSLEEAIELSRKVTEVTHDHPEGIKGAEATTVAIYMAKTGCSIAEIKEHIHQHYYPMDFTLDSIRDSYTFDGSCQGTVPQTIMAFLESNSFEDAVRNAISIGGDSDTLAAITGSIAEAYYGVSAELREEIMDYLDDFQVSILEEFEAMFKIKTERT